MLEENLVLVLLQASITGAGLVLAVYALIIPLTKTFFNYRSERLEKEVKELKEMVAVENPYYETVDLDKIRKRLDRIEKEREIPTYLGLGAGTVFFGYMVSVLMSYGWLAEWQKPTMDFWLPLAFVASTFLFLLMGLYAIKDIRDTMKWEFKDLKKLRKQMGKTKVHRNSD